jgi:tetratricopeptide (TPR) repeat protein
LRVPSRTSSFAYRGRDCDLRRIATELAVSTVLEGSIRAAGERIRITAQLIDGESGYHLWSQLYDRRFEDLFELQDDLASAIILQTLNIAVLGSPDHVLREPPTRNLEAYQLFLAAMADIRTAFRGRPAFDKLQAAVRLDPGFAKARAFLAHVRAMAVVFDIPLPGTLADAEQEALEALEKSPDSAGVHRTLGLIHAAQGRFVEADAGFRRSIALDPTEPEAWGLHGAYVLGTAGHLRAQLASTREAARLAPAAPVFNMTLAVAHAQLGMDAEARRQAQVAADLGMQRMMSPLVDVLAQLEVRAHRYDAACALMQEALTPTPSTPRQADAIRLVFEALADRQKRSGAVAAIDALRAGAGFAVLPQFVRRRMVLWYSMLEAYDAAYDVMHRSLDDFATTGTVGLVWGFLWMPELAGFRADSRFAALTERLHLPDYWQIHGAPDGYDWRDGRLIAR